MTFSINVTIEIFSADPCLISAEVLLLCTTGNREVLSAESFTVDSMFSDKHLCILEKGVDQEETLGAHLLLQATILKFDH